MCRYFWSILREIWKISTSSSSYWSSSVAVVHRGPTPKINPTITRSLGLAYTRKSGRNFWEPNFAVVGRRYGLVGFGTILQKPAVCYSVPLGVHTPLPRYPPSVWQYYRADPHPDRMNRCNCKLRFHYLTRLVFTARCTNA